MSTFHGLLQEVEHDQDIKRPTMSTFHGWACKPTNDLPYYLIYQRRFKGIWSKDQEHVHYTHTYYNTKTINAIEQWNPCLLTMSSETLLNGRNLRNSDPLRIMLKAGVSILSASRFHRHRCCLLLRRHIRGYQPAFETWRFQIMGLEFRLIH